jgi:hypothetical protein
MSQKVTLSTIISPAQSLALETLVSGESITEAAEETGVVREAVSRWGHHTKFCWETHCVRLSVVSVARGNPVSKENQSIRRRAVDPSSR